MVPAAMLVPVAPSLRRRMSPPALRLTFPAFPALAPKFAIVDVLMGAVPGLAVLSMLPLAVMVTEPAAPVDEVLYLVRLVAMFAKLTPPYVAVISTLPEFVFATPVIEVVRDLSATSPLVAVAEIAPPKVVTRLAPIPAAVL